MWRLGAGVTCLGVATLCMPLAFNIPPVLVTGNVSIHSAGVCIRQDLFNQWVAVYSNVTFDDETNYTLTGPVSRTYDECLDDILEPSSCELGAKISSRLVRLESDVGYTTYKRNVEVIGVLVLVSGTLMVILHVLGVYLASTVSSITPTPLDGLLNP